MNLVFADREKNINVAVALYSKKIIKPKIIITVLFIITPSERVSKVKAFEVPVPAVPPPIVQLKQIAKSF